MENNIWQDCPTCNGTGYDSRVLHSTTCFPPCTVCGGQKIISSLTGQPPKQQKPDNTLPHKSEQPDFEKDLDQYIYANIGVSVDGKDTTPMDKGECKYMLRQMYKDYVVPLQQEIAELKKQK